MGANPDRTMVVVELSGGNDGLNTVVPFGNDEYYRVRPNLGIREPDVIKVEDGLGFHPTMVGFERLYKDGSMAVVHGCGYENPSLSHFSSMGYWQSAVPNGGDPLGWVGLPLVFSDPSSLRRDGDQDGQAALAALSEARPSTNSALEFLTGTAQNAIESGAVVREAAAAYHTPVDYGIGGLSGPLRRVAALVAAELPTRLYYVSYAGNSFDTHVHQADPHARLLAYTADAVHGFVEDMQRIGRANHVAVMMFTEFGRGQARGIRYCSADTSGFAPDVVRVGEMG